MIIETKALTKNYGQHRGIVDLTFTIEEGEIFGFLGPNGAGKTTTIRTLLGMLRPTAGVATIGGYDCWTQSPQVKRMTGYLPGELALDPALTGGQALEYLGRLRGSIDRPYVQQLIERLGLDPSRRFREYSRGNKQKVGLIQAFMHHPRLLVLDEPTSGLDPLNQQAFYSMIEEVHANGQTVFLSSHILPEVERLCDRVGIIREGRLVEVGTIAMLKSIKHQLVEIGFAQPASSSWFDKVPGVRDVTLSNQDRTVQLTVQGDMEAVIAVAASHHALHITTHEPGLEDIFLRYYQNSALPV